MKRNNYQKLFLFREFFSSTPLKIENLINLYNLDIEIRNIIFYGLGVIETKLKTELAYYHVLKYGNHGYLNQSHFDKSNFHTIFIEEILKKVNKEKNQMIENHFSRYDDDPPLYKIIEILSFGQISKFYSNMILRDRKYFSRENYKELNFCISPYSYLGLNKDETTDKEIMKGHIYNKIRCVIDFVSGMTDSFALEIYKKIMYR